jgi:TPR repeat protein
MVYWLGHLQKEDPNRDALLQRAGELGSLEAQRGHADAQYNLGFMCLLGEGIAADPHEALRWLRLAADQEEEPAMRLLADLYRNGYHGVPIDLAEAARWNLALQNRHRRQPPAAIS